MYSRLNGTGKGEILLRAQKMGIETKAVSEKGQERVLVLPSHQNYVLTTSHGQ